jgi:hypothetical protein
MMMMMARFDFALWLCEGLAVLTHFLFFSLCFEQGMDSWLGADDDSV